MLYHVPDPRRRSRELARRLVAGALIARHQRIAIEGYPIDEAKDAPPGAVFPDALLDSPISLRLGLVDGEPASAAPPRSNAHGVVNLCFAATLDAGRRRGVWSALVWAAGERRPPTSPRSPSPATTRDPAS